MSQPASTKPEFQATRLLHLLWMVPAVLVTIRGGATIAAIAKCGVSGCSGAGFGVSADPVLAVATVVVAGAVSGAIFFFVPWARNRVLRAVVALTVAMASWIQMVDWVWGSA